jgi:hypothetical protein
MSQSLTEQALYDFKQGFLRLDGNQAFDEDSFEKILQTCAAIASNRLGCHGYVLVGVSESKETTERICKLHKVKPTEFMGWSVVGVDREAQCIGKSADEMFQWITNKVSTSKLSEPLRSFVARHLKPVRYYDKTIYVFEAEGQEDPSSYDGRYFDRRGSQLEEISADKLPTFIRRYLAGR